ncbi:OmpA family protein [Fulvivirga sediminis]|uniref:OmpA family protein n=1 Tax=Fulvivirga sediminis TaxID=2803949 RepID=A0A937JZR7_9BACT|nr:OmpA family protein [Fulvivirga sediminis]MBL3655570.1 OmpA family protein [Fulvivirga sediminis]
MRLSGFKYFFICILWLLALVATGQSRTRHTKNYHKEHYNKKLSPGRQCHRLNKKRARKKRKKWRFFSSKSTTQPRAEYDPNDTPPPPKKKETVVVKKETPKEEPKREPEKPKLPPTKSPKHEAIRERVKKDLEGREDDVYPIELDPLYFTFDESEFSVVDMEPFLIAVEYALQGRILLIEGHTDRKGKDDYNVQLSIQRVERIRQLMLDMGVPDDRISVVGYGEEKAHEDLSDDSRQKDRRVDFKVF